MKYTTTSFYKQFHCIGGICEDSCCENWEIDLDDNSLKAYMKQKGAFGNRLKNCTRVKDKQFILNGTRCPFLNDDNLCDIYIEMGEGALCETCTNFPRHIEEFHELKEVSLTMSCPEASRIMLAIPDRIEFETNEGKDEDYGLKHMEAPSKWKFWKRKHENKLDTELFDVLFETRKCIYGILQNRNIPINYRAVMILKYGELIQNAIDGEELACVKQYTDEYTVFTDSYYKEYAEEQEKRIKCYMKDLTPFYMSDEERRKWVASALHMYEGLETIKEEWKEILQAGMQSLKSERSVYENNHEVFWNEIQPRMYEFEHILVYYIFNYYLGAAYDGDALTKVKFAVISFLMITELDIAFCGNHNGKFTYEDQVLVAHAFSKEVEHSYNNFESLQLVLSAHPTLDVSHIIGGLLWGK